MDAISREGVYLTLVPPTAELAAVEAVHGDGVYLTLTGALWMGLEWIQPRSHSTKGSQGVCITLLAHEEEEPRRNPRNAQVKHLG